jgi:IS30 family transposase
LNEKKRSGTHFKKDDRDEIQILRSKGYSLQDIADVLNRPKSGIWYELQKKRKGRPYDAAYAHHLSYVRRKYTRAVGQKIALDPSLRTFIETALLDDQSPENLSLRLKRIEKHLSYASASAIRRYIKSPYGRRIESHRANVFKKRRRHRPSKPRIEGKRMIDKRPSKINKRWGLGHMEGDFIVSGKSGKGIILGLRDRKVRMNLLERILPVSVRNVERALGRMKKRYPEMQTITFDNDILFLEHQRLERILSIKIYFCHVHAPYEKPSIENLNKDLRRYIPKSSNISGYSKQFVQKLEAKMNRRFMDVLGSLTPDEAYAKEKQKRAQRSASSRRSN